VINGEALITTASIRIAQFLSNVLRRVLEGADLVARQCVDETVSCQAGNLGGATLGKPTEFLPLDGGRYAHLLHYFTFNIRSIVSARILLLYGLVM